MDNFKAMADMLNELNKVMLKKAVRDQYSPKELNENFLIGKAYFFDKNIYLVESYLDDGQDNSQLTYELSFYINGNRIVVISSELPTPTDVMVVEWDTELVKKYFLNDGTIALYKNLIEKFYKGICEDKVLVYNCIISAYGLD